MRLRHAIVAAGVALVLGVSGLVAGDPGCGWEWVNPLPPRVDLVGAVNAISRFVAVGEGGLIVTSRDGLAWQVETSGTARDLHVASWGDGHFVVAGDGIVLSSQLAHDWRIDWIANQGEVRDLAWGDGRWIAVGRELEGRLLVSDDGASWRLEPAPWQADADGVVWTGDRFVISVGSEMWSGSDGLEWALVGTVPGARLAAGAMVPHAAKADLVGLDRHDFAWDGQRLYWMDGLVLWASDDGESWEVTLGADGCEPVSAFDAVWADTNLVLATSHGACPSPYLDFVTTVWQSTDHGSTWVPIWQGAGGGLGGLARWTTRVVAVGAGGDVVMTLGGAEWRCLEAACTSAVCSDGFYDVVSDDDGLVAVGGVGLCDTSKTRAGDGTAAVSSDGAEWAVHEVSGPRLLRVARSRGVTVGLGDQWLATSIDGVSWQQQAVPSTMVVSDVGASDSEFVVVGRDGWIGTSSDGTGWGAGQGPTNADLWWIDHVAGRWLAVGEHGTVVTSNDATNWYATATSSDAVLRAAAHGGSRSVIVGEQATVLVSDDGASWFRRRADVPDDASLRDVAFGHGRYAVVGWRELAGGERAGLVLASIGGDTWTRFDPPTGGLHRIVARDDGWLIAGDDRLLMTADCLGTLLAVEPAVIGVGVGQETMVRVRLDQPVDHEVRLATELDVVGSATVPDVVVVPPGATDVGLAVVGRAAGTVSLRIRASAELGGGRVVVSIVVHGGLWNRRPSGRVGP